MAGAVERLVPQARTGLKWPNDVYLDGRKLCGILAEAVGPGAAPQGASRSRGGIVLGIGLNVHQREFDFPPGLDRPATSLRLAGAEGVDRGDLAGRILARLRSLLDPWPSRISPALLEEYARLDLLRGEPLEILPGPVGVAGPDADRGAEGGGAGSVRGVGDGIQPDGSLRLLVREGDLLPSRVIEVRSGSVRILSDPRGGGA